MFIFHHALEKERKTINLKKKKPLEKTPQGASLFRLEDQFIVLEINNHRIVFLNPTRKDMQ